MGGQYSVSPRARGRDVSRCQAQNTSMKVDHAGLVISTPRLELWKVELSDAAFLNCLLNDPSWLLNIGDRGVRTDAQASSYIEDKIWEHYDAFGYGLYIVRLKATGAPVGLCGLVKRDYLNAPDLGFALLPEHVGRGYVSEAATHLLPYVKSRYGVDLLYAIVQSGNGRSIKVLMGLGFQAQGPYRLPQGEEVELYLRT
jgi:[ribosomal protein S5]-alanine N-acetyltransferase